MTPSVLRRSAFAVLANLLVLALIAPMWRPDFLSLPGAYPGPAPTPAFTLRTLWLLVPLSICTLGLHAFLSGALKGWQLVALAVLSSYLGILASGYLQIDSEFALHRRMYQASYARDALLFDSWGELLATYDAHQLELTGRGRTHPPGAAGLHWLTMRFGRVLAGWFGEGTDPDYEAFVAEGYLGAYLWSFLQALWLLPAWGLARRLYGERAAGVAACFGALAPSVIVIAPSIDGFQCLFAALGMYLLERGFNTGKLRWSACSGLVCAIATGITWAFGALVPLYLAYFCLRRPKAMRPGWMHSPWMHMLAIPVGGAAFFGSLYALWGFHPFVPLADNLGTHYGSAVNAVRPYAPFLLISPFTFFAWAGVPLVIGFGMALVRSKPLGVLRGRDPLVLATFVGLLVITLSGATRGETERLWLPLLPFVVIAGGHGLSSGFEGRSESRKDDLGWASMLTITVLSSVLLGNWWSHHH